MPERNSAPPEGEALMMESVCREADTLPSTVNAQLDHTQCPRLNHGAIYTSETGPLGEQLTSVGSRRPSSSRLPRRNSISSVSSVPTQASASQSRRRCSRPAAGFATCSSCAGESPRSSSRRALLGRPSYAVGRPADERPLKRESMHSSGSSSILQSRAGFSRACN
jgi:hypothetical protein